MGNTTFFLKKLYLKLPVIAYDLFSIPFSWYVAYVLRYNLDLFPHRLFLENTVSVLLLLMLVQTISYYHFKVYRGLWRFSSLNDLGRICYSVFYATIVVIPILYSMNLLQEISRAIFPLYLIILVMTLSGGRLLYRNYWTKRSQAHDHVESKRVLIVGAGQAGEGLIRDLKRTKTYIPVGLVDDNLTKRDLEVHGVQVLGTIEELPRLVNLYEVDLIFIAIPSAGSISMRRIVKFCEATDIPFSTLPSLHALASGQVQMNALRKVKLDDLLGRDQIQLSWDKIKLSIQGKRILITGGGGSIGSELCRQVMALAPAQLLILDNNEFNLYSIERELRQSFPNIPLEISLHSVTDIVFIEQIFRAFKPNIVFHAAAYKHVPLLEQQVQIAVQNNVFGTQVVAQASVAANVDKFILISTDKAVNPTNIMGTTKRVAEIYCQNLNTRVSTQFVTVRFGNVLGSIGSVVPLFQKQLEQGGPLTVTHPDIERYFMTIPEATQLILQAMVNGEGGEIFVFDMGEPIKIRYLAEQMIRLAGKKPGVEVSIEYTGLRPGEKLFEELFHRSEQLENTDHVKLFKAKFRPMDWEQLNETLRLMRLAYTESQQDELVVLLKSLVPEFAYDMSNI